MSDPCSNYFNGWFNPNPMHHFSSSTSSSNPSFHCPYGFNLNINYCHSSPPSPPLREALPLLSLSPTRPDQEQDSSFCTSMEVDKNKDKEESFLASSADNDETVTLALHLGLSNPSSAYADQISRLSSSTEMADKEEEVTIASGSPTSPLNKGQYWIPTPAQILIGPTQLGK